MIMEGTGGGTVPSLGSTEDGTVPPMQSSTLHLNSAVTMSSTAETTLWLLVGQIEELAPQLSRSSLRAAVARLAALDRGTLPDSLIPSTDATVIDGALGSVAKRSPPTSAKRVNRSSCGECAGCRTPDCNACKYCRDKPKLGGSGTLRRRCILRSGRAAERSTARTKNNGPAKL